MERAPGTYAIVFACTSPARIEVGSRGPLTLEAGFYIYVGSALGPAGVGARVDRHCRRDKPMRWHIDYLSVATEPVGAWYCHGPDRLEHRWAEQLASCPEIEPVAEFGSSDCRCATHLFFSAKPPDPALGGNLGARYDQLRNHAEDRL